MPLTAGAAANDGLTARTHAIFDARLSQDADHPVAIALSGGGDSMALLALAADWAALRGRPLLALTVDHGLSPASGRWSDLARQACRERGVDWRGLTWDGPKPSVGLPAAARTARHGLIADAARAAGAQVVLFAHTADDVAEGDWMRAEGSTLGRLREWAPSPAWPQGRGLMLLRPLLGARRGDLRDWLTGRGIGWVEDPANDDVRFARTRARRALATIGKVEAGAEPTVETPFDYGRHADWGVLQLARQDLSARRLAATLVCAGGGDAPPRGARLAWLVQRLQAREDFAATLSGARIEAAGDQVRVMRDAGEFARRGAEPLSLPAGRPVVWDGRFEVQADDAGWFVAAATGRLARLSDQDRAVLAGLPPAARGTMPVLIRDRTDAPVLAWRAATVRPLVGQRLGLALDETTHERDLAAATHGAMAPDRLFSGKTLKTGAGQGPAGQPRNA